MQIIKNYLYNALYQIFILIVPLVTTPYLARVLGPTGIGINSYTNSVIQYFILLGSVGVSLYGNRQIAFVRENKKKLSQTFYEIFFMRCFTIILSYFAFMLFLLFTSNYFIYYLAQSISIIAAALDISWFFMGVENFVVTILRNLIVKIITVISIFLLVKSIKDLSIYILILSLSLLIGNFSLFPSLRKYIRKPNFQALKIFRHLKPSIVLFIPQVAIQIYLVLNKTMLGAMDSVTAAGYFDSSDKIVRMVLAVVTATGTVMLPHVANAFAKGEKQKTKKYLYKIFSFVSCIAVPMMFGLMAICRKFVPLFFSNQFSAVIPVMEIESIIVLLIAWGSALGDPFLLPTNQIRPYTLSVIFGAVINLIANIPLILLWGAVGTSIATVLSEATVTFYRMFSIRNQVEYKLLFVDFFKYLFSGVIMFVIVKTLDDLLPNSWLMLSVEILVGILVYLIGLILSKAKILNELKLILKN